MATLVEKEEAQSWGDSRGQRHWDRAEQMKSRTCDFSSALGHILKYVRLAFTITFTHRYIRTPMSTSTPTHMHINGGMMRQLSLRVCLTHKRATNGLGFSAVSFFASVCVCALVFLRFLGSYFLVLCAGVPVYIFVSISMTANNICT